MKHIFIFLIFTLISNADLSVKQIEHMVQKIHEKRQGVKLDTLEDTAEPFVRKQEENNVTSYIIPIKVEVEKVKLILHAIVNGKAFINDKWLNPEDNIMGYTLKHIGNRGVVLRNGNHIKKLFLHKKRDNYIHIKGR